MKCNIAFQVCKRVQRLLIQSQRSFLRWCGSQALEPSSLIALQLLAPGGRLVLVGDPAQLPATVVSRAAAGAALAQSLFERLQQVCGLVQAVLVFVLLCCQNVAGMPAVPVLARTAIPCTAAFYVCCCLA
jgi:hypothetical protein